MMLLLAFGYQAPVPAGGGRSHQLLVQRDLVKLELVNLSRGSAQQRRGCEQGDRLHDGVGWERMMITMEREVREDKDWAGGGAWRTIGVT